MVKTKLFLLKTILLLGVSGALAQDFPPTPNRLVNDYTQTLTAAQVQQLEHKLVAFDDSTSTQIAVVLMQSTGQYDIADYGVRLAQRWGVGGKDHDNGILLLVALGDRAVTIQTGYGVEGAVPDAIAYRIIENEIKPAFRRGDYFTGIDRATDALIAYTKGEYTAPPKRDGKGGSGSIVLILIIVFVLVALLSRGGGGRGGGKVLGGRGASDLLWWTLLSGMGRGGGRGGFGGGFGSGGGGFGGGGFGGFGGGGFGGGGASGRW
ncbi:TPM domain-containing protein [Parapedobacter sp. ISTM3]|nr:MULTISPECIES: TPM domain-containing protein [Parapedobacter]MBK1440546.1 TPM domain-containing protein [Parapedobacter sp. ISTM3]